MEVWLLLNKKKLQKIITREYIYLYVLNIYYTDIFNKIILQKEKFLKKIKLYSETLNDMYLLEYYCWYTKAIYFIFLFLLEIIIILSLRFWDLTNSISNFNYFHKNPCIIIPKKEKSNPSGGLESPPKFCLSHDKQNLNIVLNLLNSIFSLKKFNKLWIGFALFNFKFDSLPYN